MTDGRAFDWRRGVVAGIVGAIAYTVIVEAVNIGANGMRAFFFPFRQIGAILLGSDALNASYSLLSATLVGTVLHFAIAAAFGAMLAGVTARFALSSTSNLFALGVAAGLTFYALNVFIIFPAAFPWFLENSRLTQSLGHAVFGGVTGAWLALSGRSLAGR